MRFAFVLEQGLGHAAHSGNLERALSAALGIEATVVKLSAGPLEGPSRVLGISNWSLRASVMARRALHRRLREGPLDAVFVHTQVASLLCRDVMRAVPTVVSLDATPKNFDDVGPAYGHARASPVTEWAKAAVCRRALRGAAALVTWSRLAADSLFKDYGIDPAGIHVIPPGVDVARFHAQPGARGNGPVRLLFVGGDFVRKGGRDLLEAVSGLERDDVELDIVTGKVVGPVPTGVMCRVHQGLRPGTPDLHELYARADVFVMPSRGDCMPQALAEAAASGLPLVATVTGAIPEIVHHGRNGMLVKPGSPDQLRLALQVLIDNRRLRHSMGEASLSLARSEHDAAHNNRRIFELMASLAATQRAA